MISKAYVKVFPASIENICPVVDEVLQYVKHLEEHVGEDAIFNIKVVLNELLINAIIHGSSQQEGKHVVVKCSPCVRQSVKLKVKDEGEGFNYYKVIGKEMNDCKCEETNYKESGRGMLIVQSLCDSVSYNDNGSEIEVVVRLK